MRTLLASLTALFATSAAIAQPTIVQSWTVPPVGTAFIGGLGYDAITDEVWTVDETNDLIQRFTRTGTMTATFAPPVVPGIATPQPIGAAVDQVTGNVWVVDEAEVAYEIDRAGTFTGRSWSTAPAITDASAITIDPSSRTLFVSNDSARVVQEFSLAGVAIGAPISMVAAGSVDPDGIVYNHLTQTFYLGEDTGDQIIEVTRAGALVRTISLVNLPPTNTTVSPEGLDLDTRTGSLFVGSGFSSGRMVFEIGGIVPAPVGSVTPYGAGCPDSGGMNPRATAGSLLQTGRSVDLAVQTTVLAGSNAQAALLFGAGRTSINLGFLGFPACNLLVNPLVTISPLPLNSNRRAGLTLLVPAVPSLVGGRLDVQAALLPDLGPLLSLSNGVEVVIQ